MPRVQNQGDNVEAWCDETGREHGTTHDLCTGCFGRLEADSHAWDGVLAPREPGEPPGTGGWGGDLPHPPYAYMTACCAVCGAPLTVLDDRRSADCCGTPDAACAAHCPLISVTTRRPQ